MIKVLIVDDEKTIREGLFKTVPWEAHGCVVLGALKNGKEGLDFVEKNPVDLVVCDIKMPILSGLEFQKETIAKGLKIPFLFLSGYEDFSFVQEALRLGACSYLLKPVDIPLLLTEIDRIASEHIQSTDQKTIIEVIQSNFSGFDLKSSYDEFEVFQEELENSYFCAVNLRCGFREDCSELTISVFEEKLLDVSQSMVSKEHLIVLERSSRGLMLALMYQDKSEIKLAISALIDALNSYLEEQGEIPVCILAGSIYQGVSKLLSSYAEAFDNSFVKYTNQNNLNGYGAGELSYNVYYQLFSNETELISLLLKGDLPSALALLDQQKNFVRESEIGVNASRFYLKHLLHQTLSSVKSSNPELDFPLEKFHKSLDNEDISAMFEEFFRIFEEISQSLRPIVVKQSAKLLEKVKEFIEQNYTDPYLTLTSIANNIGFNYSYLSTEFTKYFGVNISVYLTDIRMEQARVLLTTTDLRVLEISTQVGYLNTTYFSTIFKKKFHCSPSQYRRNLCSADRKEF